MLDIPVFVKPETLDPVSVVLKSYPYDLAVKRTLRLLRSNRISYSRSVGVFYIHTLRYGTVVVKNTLVARRELIKIVRLELTNTPTLKAEHYHLVLTNPAVKKAIKQHTLRYKNLL